MRANEIEATLGYLEFHLIKFVEDTERQVHDPDIIGDMYDRAYAILNDFEQTLDTQMLIDEQEKVKGNN